MCVYLRVCTGDPRYSGTWKSERTMCQVCTCTGSCHVIQERLHIRRTRTTTGGVDDPCPCLSGAFGCSGQQSSGFLLFSPRVKKRSSAAAEPLVWAVRQPVCRGARFSLHHTAAAATCGIHSDGSRGGRYLLRAATGERNVCVTHLYCYLFPSSRVPDAIYRTYTGIPYKGIVDANKLQPVVRIIVRITTYAVHETVAYFQ